jgi:hypothetical protein
MAETHVVSGLRAKRAEIAGYVHDLEKRVRTWRTRLAHLDATIRMFSPDTDPEAIPPRRVYRRSRYFQRGEFARLCHEELRKTEAPISAGAIARAVMAIKGLSADDPALFQMVNDKALGFLREQRKRGTVTKTGVSRDARWLLTDAKPSIGC